MRLPGGLHRLALRKLIGQQRRCFASRIVSPARCLVDRANFFRPETGLSRLVGGLLGAPIGDVSDARQQQRRGFLGFGDGDEDRGLSKHYEEKRVMGYAPEQLFDVVAGVDMYEEFVPWCQRSNVIWQKGGELEAELEIGFQFFVESYTSHVQLTRPKLIKTSVSKSAIFEYLNNTWEISPGPSPATCNLHFTVDFQFRSPLYTKVANVFFDEVVARLVAAFENRCLRVYGPSKVVMHA
ncbi:coenzyme Q-binding protein COQ10 homolog B, mitochondrial [Selaginella moellendorffii]|nr:coenzyme Q-binding protein COQ10 homolog B, mitochondrial [Selaginella moellendorffii]|eukprot:XP_002967738.2 coenzyme Q-binding protein COQ10 homolog B, mitochondrial [Selaginella moellendorffii]